MTNMFHFADFTLVFPSIGAMEWTLPTWAKNTPQNKYKQYDTLALQITPVPRIERSEVKIALRACGVDRVARNSNTQSNGAKSPGAKKYLHT